MHLGGRTVPRRSAHEAGAGAPEVQRSRVSNVHDDGADAVEAGVRMTDVIIETIRRKASGVNPEA